MKQVIGLISICLFCSTLLSAQLSISIESQSVKLGDEVCLEVMVEGFQNILSFQAEFIQDDSLLTFSRFIHSNFPDSLWEDTYAHDARIAWISNDLINGSSIEDSTSLISVCYTTNKTGVSPISIFHKPTGPLWFQFLPLEVYNSEEQLLEVAIQEGVVIIEEPAAAKETEGVEENLTTSTSNVLLPKYSFQLFPNLVVDYLKIIGTDHTAKDIHLYGMDGHLYQHFQTTNKEVRIQTNHLAKGSYLVYIRTDLGSVTRKFVKM